MVAYSFQRRFVEPIQAWTKRQTIRAVGKRRHARPGDKLQLYFGMRTIHCRKIADAVCSGFGPIAIDFSGWVKWNVGEGENGIIDREDLDEFAVLDGFKNWRDLLDFWAIHHFDGARPTGKWSGVIIQWNSPTTPPSGI